MIENETWVIGIFKFSTKYNLLCLLNWIWIKFRFPLKCTSKSLTDFVIFSTTENRYLSSSNNFAVNTKSPDKLFMYIRKKNGPNLGPCGAPASVATHEEYCPFRTNLCFRLM